jgi:hypothetical protein
MEASEAQLQRIRSGEESERGAGACKLEISAALWKTPHGMGNIDASGKHGGSGGGEFAKQANNWTTPQAHDSGGGDPERVRRKGTEHGCANLADDVTKWPTPDASMANGGRMSAEPMLTVRPSGTKKAITLNDATQSGIWQ